MYKIKKWLKSTFLYRVYLFFLVKFRSLKSRLKRLKKKLRSKLRKKTDSLYLHYLFDVLYPKVYKKFSSLPVDENKILFVELRLPKLTNSFKVIFDELYENYDYDIHCHFLRKTFVSRPNHRKRCVAFIKDLATAKYVFMDEATNINGKIQIRPETVITQLWHGCGAFKKFGMSTADAIFGATREQMEKYPFNKGYTNVTVSSPEVVWAYEEAMNYTHESGVVKPLGSSRTDIFYDENFIKQSFEALYEIMPQARGKKVILYAPTFRGRVASATAPKVFNVELMKYALGDEYVLITKHHPLVRKVPKIPKSCVDFATDMTRGGLSIEELICVSDICISDYSSLVFEYSLFERPMIFLAHDLEKFFDWRGFYYDYFELSPGPVVENTTEIVDYIKNIDERFDKERVHAFREKFMSSCDGHATQRIIETAITKEQRQKHKRAVPLEKKNYHLIPAAKDFSNGKYLFEN